MKVYLHDGICSTAYKRILICVVASVSLISNYAVFAQNNAQSADEITNSITVKSQDTDTAKKVDFTSQVDSAKKILKSLAAKNETQESDIVGAVKDKIDSSISVSFGDNNEKFDRIDATTTKEGSITGTLILQDNIGDRKAIIVDLTIDKLKSDNNDLSAKPETMKEEQAGQEVTTGAAVTVDTIPVTMKTEIAGDSNVGGKLIDQVEAYNAESQEVKLDESKIIYDWEANGKKVGDKKELVITPEISGEKIVCNVNYNDGKEER